MRSSGELPRITNANEAGLPPWPAAAAERSAEAAPPGAVVRLGAAVQPDAELAAAALLAARLRASPEEAGSFAAELAPAARSHAPAASNVVEEPAELPAADDLGAGCEPACSTAAGSPVDSGSTAGKRSAPVAGPAPSGSAGCSEEDEPARFAA